MVEASSSLTRGGAEKNVGAGERESGPVGPEKMVVGEGVHEVPPAWRT